MDTITKTPHNGERNSNIELEAIEPVRTNSTTHTSRPTSMLQTLNDGEENPPVRTKLKTTAIMIAIYLSLFISALDQTITATAIPTITSNLGSSSGYFWIGGAYLLASAATSSIWAKLSDIWGRKLCLLACVALFAAASVLAALSTTMRMLIAGRALQGTAGGGVIPIVAIIISDLFSQRERTLYLGLLEVVWALAGGLGPIIGGAFTQKLSWRWCFWINLPVSGTAFVLLVLFLDVHNPRTRIWEGIKAIDWFGTMSILAVVLLLLLGLDFGGAVFPWDSPRVICLIVFGVLCIGIFIFSEKKVAKYPLMPLSMFKNWSNNAAFAVCFCHGMGFICAGYYLPLYLQAVKGASPLRSGILVLPLGLPEAAAGIVTGVLIHRTGRYQELTWFGMTFLTLGFGLFILLKTSTPLWQIVLFQVIEGIGSGCLFESPMVAVQAVVEQRDTATATATFSLVRNIATSMGIVIGGVIFQNGMSTRVPYLRSAGLDEGLLSAFSEDSAGANVEVIKGIMDEGQRRAVEDAFAWSLRNMWVCFTVISGLGLLISVFIKHKDLKKEHTETRTGIGEMTKREDGI